eukprot:766824-Hanusia_phi.AAC.1
MSASGRDQAGGLVEQEVEDEVVMRERGRLTWRWRWTEEGGKRNRRGREVAQTDADDVEVGEDVCERLVAELACERIGAGAGARAQVALHSPCARHVAADWRDVVVAAAPCRAVDGEVALTAGLRLLEEDVGAAAALQDEGGEAVMPDEGPPAPGRLVDGGGAAAVQDEVGVHAGGAGGRADGRVREVEGWVLTRLSKGGHCGDEGGGGGGGEEGGDRAVGELRPALQHGSDTSLPCLVAEAHGRHVEESVGEIKQLHGRSGRGGRRGGGGGEGGGEKMMERRREIVGQATFCRILLVMIDFSLTTGRETPGRLEKKEESVDFHAVEHV